MSSKGWSNVQDSILREYYPLGGGKLCQEKGLDKKLSTIRMRAKSLGIKSKYSVWTDDEVAILYKLHKDTTLSGISSELPNRSVATIKKKLEELGLPVFVKWTDNEIKIIKEYFPKGGSKLVKSKGVNKSTNLIAAKANSLGVRLLNSRVMWTDEEELILKEYYPTEGMSVVKRLAGKSPKNIVSKLNNITSQYRVKYAHWSDAEKLLLKENKGKSIKDLLLLFPEREADEVEDLVTYFRWKYAAKVINWSSEELHLLCANYNKCDIKELQAMGLSKSEFAISKKLKELGLKRESISGYWSDKDISILVDGYKNGKSLDELCMLLPHKYCASIRSKANLLNLNRSKSSIWGSAEVAILKKYYSVGGSKLVLAELSKIGVINRTDVSIHRKASKLGIRYNRQCK